LNLERDIESELLADCDGVRLLPGLASHVQRISGSIGRRRALGWRDVRHHLRAIARFGCCCDLPPSASRHEPDHGSRIEGRLWRHDGAFIVTGLAFVAPRLGPTQTFILYFSVIAVTSALIDGFGLLGTEARPLEARQLVGVLLAGVGLVLARS
jgi:hypothetical protein